MEIGPRVSAFPLPSLPVLGHSGHAWANKCAFVQHEKKIESGCHVIYFSHSTINLTSSILALRPLETTFT